MALANAGAVLFLEIRADPRARSFSTSEIDARLDEARALLESAEPGRSTWTPAGGGTLAGRMGLDDSEAAFPFVVRMRTILRESPKKAPLVVLAGLGHGEDSQADRLAGEAFRALGARRHAWTSAMTPSEGANRVLAVLCRAIDALERGWTASQWEAIVRRDRGVTLQSIGDELGIAYQNVSKRLIAAQYSLHGELLDAANFVFSSDAPPFA